MGRLFSLDAATKSAEHFHYDEATGQFAIEDVQQVDDILAVNAALRSEHVSQKNTFRQVGSVPSNIYQYWQNKWLAEGRSRREIRQLWKDYLNDADHKQFKTTDARI